MNSVNSIIKTINKQTAMARFYDADRLIFLFVIAFFSARTDFSGINFVILPLVGFAYLLGAPVLIATISGVLAGSATVNTEFLLQQTTAISLFLFITLSLAAFKKITTQQRVYVAVPITYLCYNYFFIALSINQENLVLPLVGAIIAFWFSHFCIRNIADFVSRQYKNYQQIYPIFITSLIVIASFGVWNIYFVQSNLIVTTLLILFLMKSAGYQATITVALISAILFLFSGVDVNLFIILVVSMTFSILVEEFPKLTIAFFYLSAFFLTAHYLNYEIVNNYLIVNPLIAISLFLLMDNRLFKVIQARMPWMLASYHNNKKKFLAARKKIGSKVTMTSEMLEKIAEELAKGENGRQMRQAMEEIYVNLCSSCPKASICYQEKMIQIMPKAIIKGLSSKDITFIEDNCLKPAKLLTKIDEKRRTYSYEYKYAQEYRKLKELVATQLKGLSRILYACQEEIENESEDALEIKGQKLAENLKQQGYDVLYISISQDREHTQLEGAVFLKNYQLLEKEIIPFLKKALFLDLSLVRSHRPGFDGYCRFILRSTKQYYLTYGVSQIGKDFLNCGDTYRFFKGQNEVIIALSDGMGTGEIAAKQSQLSVAVLEKMLSSGISSIEAIENLNTFLKIKNASEIFATIDIMAFNQKSGRALFTKSGAYPSYIIKNKVIQKIDSSTTPVGIIDSLEVKSQTISLDSDDIIVMMSDGVEGLIDDIETTLISLVDVDMQKMSSQLLQVCQKNKIINDDITIVCAKVSTS